MPNQPKDARTRGKKNKLAGTIAEKKRNCRRGYFSQNINE
jgi:hypothetical protein